jgi:deoxyribonuclease IV
VVVVARAASGPLLLGAHLSIEGGVGCALERARALRCTAVQLFTHNRAQWRITPLAESEVRRFRELNAARGPFALAAHATYLANPASPDRALRGRSIRALIDEVHHCAALGIPALVLHPGAHMGAGERAGVRRVIAALDRIHAATAAPAATSAVAPTTAPAAPAVRTLLETTAGQGTGLGWRFEQLAEILAGLAAPERAGICFDTAHAFAAGYDFRGAEQYAEIWREFDRTLGLERLAFFHLNDSLTPAGSRVDRHTHIGRGEIGARPFGRILADERFARVPKVIETPKEGDMDRVNLARLRRLYRERMREQTGEQVRHGGQPR